MNAPFWPQSMKRRTAAAYCDLTEGAFLREVAAGRLPQGVTFGGREHWHKPALDAALARIAGDIEEVPEYRRKLRERYGKAAA